MKPNHASPGLAVSLSIPLLTALAVLGPPGESRAQLSVIPGFEGPVEMDLSSPTFVWGADFAPIPGGAHFGALADDDDQFDAVTGIHTIEIKYEPVWNGSRDFTGIARRPPVAAAGNNPGVVRDYFAIGEAGTNPGTFGIHVIGLPTGALNTLFFDVDNIPTVPGPDDAIHRPALAVDAAGNCVVGFTELTGTGTIVNAQLFLPDGTPNGSLSPFPSFVGPHNSPDTTFLGTGGNRLAFTASGSSSTSLAIYDVSGPSPTLIHLGPISTTFGAGNFNPSIAANPATGGLCVGWENDTGDPTNGLDIRARRFTGDGTALGPDFLVNTETTGNQSQPDVAYGPGGESVFVYAGDTAGTPGTDFTDIYFQAYGLSGAPLDGEIVVNSDLTGYQDRPVVHFLPDPDPLGRPQCMVLWRDCAGPDGASPRGSGLGYRCFSLGSPDTDGDGLTDDYELLIGTDAFNPDTDGDGQNDGSEVNSGFNPLSAKNRFELHIAEVNHILNTITLEVPNSNPGKTYSLIKSVDDFESFLPVPGQQNRPGNGESLIFSDGFESGDTSAWSATVP